MVETTRRQEIEDAASSLFHEHGYSGTSVRDIARAVDIQGASLYAHVASKQEVLWSIVERTASRFEAAADAVEAADPGSLVFGPGVHLISLVRAHVGVVTDDIERASVFVHEWRSLDRGRRDDIARRRDAYEKRFRDAIGNGVEAGVFVAVDPIPTAAYILSALNGLVAWYQPNGRLNARTIADIYADLSLRAVQAHRGPGMTDPLALEPILGPLERGRPAFNEDLPHDERYALFEEHVGAGLKIEATDWMPDEYRTAVLRFVEMHANSELMGVLPEREWLMRAPTLRRKLALTAKVQDEVGHAQLLYRVAEDLGKPREAMFDDLLAGKTKFHNVFHYPTVGWADVGMIAWLVDAAAIVAQQALRDSSYAPYARTMRKVCWEESVHIMHGRDVVVTMVTGSPAQRAAIQDALERWWGPLMQMHGPRSPREKDRDLHWRIKAKTSEELRQEFLTIYVPRIRELGLVIPDDELRYDETAGEWRYAEPDWDELRTVVTNHGPMSQERLEFRRVVREETRWVRESILGVPRAA